MSSQPTLSVANAAEWKMAASIVEMLVSNRALRMCPELKYDVTGLDPYKVYTASIVLERVDDYKYSFQNNQWCQWSIIDEPASPQMIIHKLGPQIGADWMTESIDFSWIYISRKANNDTFVLEPHHCYQPRLVLASEDEEFYLDDAIQKFIPVSNNNKRMQKFRDELREFTGKPLKSRKRAATATSSNQEPKAKKLLEPLPMSFTYNAPTQADFQYYPQYHYEFPVSPMIHNSYYYGFPSSPMLQQPPTPTSFQSSPVLQNRLTPSNSLTGSPTNSNASSDDLDVFNEFFYANPAANF